MTKIDFQDGDRLWRVHTWRGGYGYTITVPVTFVRHGDRKATVLADLRDGSQKQVNVDPSKLNRFDTNGQPPPKRK